MYILAYVLGKAANLDENVLWILAGLGILEVVSRFLMARGQWYFWYDFGQPRLAHCPSCCPAKKKAETDEV